MNSTDFSSLGLPSPLLESVASLGFSAMTPVQAQALPEILAGKDVLVQAETGGGKTAAFGLGILALLAPEMVVQALVVCPTRELADQVSGELRRFASRMPNIKVLTLCGGTRFGGQRDSLKQGAHIVVGAPGRLDEHLRKSSLVLYQLKVLVLDEADRMLDMGFEPQLAALVAYAPAARQTLLFSATYPDSIAGLSRKYQRKALRITLPSTRLPEGEQDAAQPGTPTLASVQQHFYRVPASGRIAALGRWLARERPESTLVFCNMRSECDDVANQLRGMGWVAASIHGELPQSERLHVMRLFANKSCSVLAATDVAARGWDIEGLSAVVNLGLPRDPTVHLHRLGRTGRSGRSGVAVSFVSNDDDLALSAIERYQGHQITLQELPRAAGTPAAGTPPMVTLLLGAGKNKKLRPGDILGALTAEGGVEGNMVGAIQIEESSAYVAIASLAAERALLRLREGPIKGRTIKVRMAGLRLREG
jgi:ATP-independent RNA helicase DbpA